MLTDRFGRQIDYLRLSVTGECNLRCVYCRPPDCEPPSITTPELTVEEMVSVVGVAGNLGMRHVRLTGGEPLLRDDLLDLVRRISVMPAITDLSLTTNGQLLADSAADLVAAGLHRVNVSMDSLDPERYRLMTGGGDLGRVWAGLDMARRAGLQPLKINAVLLRGHNDGEIDDFVQLARDETLHVRFIELLPTGPAASHAEAWFYPVAQVLADLGLGTEADVAEGGPGPARLWRVGAGTVGIISSVTAPPCASCNRLRLTCEGTLRPCLTAATEIDLRPALAAPNSEQAIAAAFEQVVSLKPQCGPQLSGQWHDDPVMCRVGG